MLENIIKELSNNFNYSYNKESEDNFIIIISDEICINISKIEEEIYFYSPITSCPEDKKEEIYTYIMKANLLGQGTGNATIGLDNNEKFLTLSYVMPYEEDYTIFKEKVEDFVNFLIFWKEEIKKQVEKSILG
jgi:hypothetical protein